MTSDHLQPHCAESKRNPKKSTKNWRPDTAAWWKATRRLTSEERGFAIAVLVLMRKQRRTNLALVLEDVGSLAEDLHSTIEAVARLRECFDAIPPDVVRGQRRNIATWPAWLVEEIAP